jgi:5'-methylthioadenosine phosphorylase
VARKLDQPSAEIGIIGGSGLYEMEGLQQVREKRITTPFGRPSDALLLGTLDGVRIAFLARHGRGHRLSPSEINYRANIYALKSVGVSRIISVSAVGSMKETVKPGDLLLPDQFIDLTKQRASTFFQEGIVAHVAMGDPVCPTVYQALARASRAIGATVHEGGTYVCMEGPQFSTRGESLLYRQWGVDVIGMTNMPEAKLAREAELCYATLALATDYDCWHESEDSVSVEMILATLHKNVELAKRVIRGVLPIVREARDCLCADALKYAIVTPPKIIPRSTRRKLDLLIGRHMPSKKGGR